MDEERIWSRPRVSLVADGAQAGAWTQVRIHSHFSQS